MCSVILSETTPQLRTRVYIVSTYPEKGRKERRREGGREDKGKERQEEKEEELSAVEHKLQEVMTVCSAHPLPSPLSFPVQTPLHQHFALFSGLEHTGLQPLCFLLFSNVLFFFPMFFMNHQNLLHELLCSALAVVNIFLRRQTAPGLIRVTHYFSGFPVAWEDSYRWPVLSVLCRFILISVSETSISEIGVFQSLSPSVLRGVSPWRRPTSAPQAGTLVYRQTCFHVQCLDVFRGP